MSDEINVFGLLRFDKANNMYFMDEPLAMLSLKEGIQLFQDSLMWKQMRYGFTIIGFWGLAVASLITFTKCSVKVFQSIYQRRLEQMKELYKEMDFQNKLENCPPFVRVPSQSLS